jgi:hypothetical protein
MTMGGRIWAAPRAVGGAEFGFALRTVEDGSDHPAPVEEPSPVVAEPAAGQAPAGEGAGI